MPRKCQVTYKIAYFIPNEPLQSTNIEAIEVDIKEETKQKSLDSKGRPGEKASMILLK